MKQNPVPALEAFFSKYMQFPYPAIAFPLALWTVATHCFESFDVFPYLCITSNSKRCGKTRLSELIGFTCNAPRAVTGITPAALFRIIAHEKPTLINDESENLHSEAASMMRSVLNAGYRKGQTVPRVTTGGEIEHFAVYCPKVFVLIGDTNATLRDRSIVIVLRRGNAPARFLYEPAKDEGEAIRTMIRDARKTDLKDAKVFDAYRKQGRLDFLNDRDEEIWLPLFTIAALLCPERLQELAQIAADLSVGKTAPKRRYAKLEREETAADDEYSRKLLADLFGVLVVRGGSAITSVDAIRELFAKPLAPWAKFKGRGLTPLMLANMLSRFGVRPHPLRFGTKVAKGYKKESLEKALRDV